MPFHEGAVKAAKVRAFHEARSPLQARHRLGMYSSSFSSAFSSSSSKFFFFFWAPSRLLGRGFLFAGPQAKTMLFGLFGT